MKFNDNVLLRYMSLAPLPLAFERYLECQILAEMDFVSPILDLGCGDGLFAHILFSEQIDTGIDPNPDELTHARMLRAYSELLACPGDAIPKADGSYRTIFSNSVLEHIPDLAPVFKEVHRLLVPQGKFYITVPAPQFEHNTLLNRFLMGMGLSGLAASYRKFCSRVIWRQSHYYSVEEWGSMVAGFGFTVEKSFTYDPELICLMNDFLYPFSILDAINKRIFNRWVLFPYLRQILLYPIYVLVRNVLKNGTRAHLGGLVFVSFVRKDD